MTTNRIAFLFGAGISIPAGIDSTETLTKKILSGEGVIRHTDSSYYLASTPDYLKNDIPRIINFLNILKNIVDYYYKDWPSRNANYEDLYYIASQIYDDYSGEYDNPALQPLVNDLKLKAETLLPGDDNRHDWKFQDLLREVTNGIPSKNFITLPRELITYHGGRLTLFLPCNLHLVLLYQITGTFSATALNN